MKKIIQTSVFIFSIGLLASCGITPRSSVNSADVNPASIMQTYAIEYDEASIQTTISAGMAASSDLNSSGVSGLIVTANGQTLNENSNLCFLGICGAYNYSNIIDGYPSSIVSFTMHSSNTHYDTQTTFNNSFFIPFKPTAYSLSNSISYKINSNGILFDNIRQFLSSKYLDSNVFSSNKFDISDAELADGSNLSTTNNCTGTSSCTFPLNTYNLDYGATLKLTFHTTILSDNNKKLDYYYTLEPIHVTLSAPVL